MKEEYIKSLAFISLLSIGEFILGILIFVYLPKKDDYFGNVLIKYHKAILGFSISLFIINIVFIFANIVSCCTNNRAESETVCYCHLVVIMYLKLISSFIEWSITLASITLINKTEKKNKGENYDYTSELKDKSVKVVIFVSIYFALNIAEIIIASCVYRYQCFKPFKVYPTTPENKVIINVATVVTRSGNDVIIDNVGTVKVQNSKQ
jgi:hypothetical protein